MGPATLVGLRGQAIKTAPASQAFAVPSAHEPRRFPPPWRVVELPGGYAVEDANGQRLGTFYGRDDPSIARQAGARPNWREYRAQDDRLAERAAVYFARHQRNLRSGLSCQSPDRIRETTHPAGARVCRGCRQSRQPLRVQSRYKNDGFASPPLRCADD
jgi:hypothetical protein